MQAVQLNLAGFNLASGVMFYVFITLQARWEGMWVFFCNDPKVIKHQETKTQRIHLEVRSTMTT